MPHEGPLGARNRRFTGTSHAGGGTRTPDTRIMIRRALALRSNRQLGWGTHKGTQARMACTRRGPRRGHAGLLPVAYNAGIGRAPYATAGGLWASSGEASASATAARHGRGSRRSRRPSPRRPARPPTRSPWTGWVSVISTVGVGDHVAHGEVTAGPEDARGLADHAVLPQLDSTASSEVNLNRSRGSASTGG